MSKALNHVASAVDEARAQYEKGRINSAQAISDISVAVMSQMTRSEIENCLYMAIGADGVGDLIASTLCDLQAVASSKPKDSK